MLAQEFLDLIDSIAGMLKKSAAPVRAAKMPAREARDLIDSMAGKAFDVISHVGEQRFLEGDKGSLLSTLYWFLDFRLAPPEWVRKEFVGAVRSNPRSWDAVFDRPKKRKCKGVIEAGIAGGKLRDGGVAIGDDFFKRLGIDLK
jgi:hypothetical protein